MKKEFSAKFKDYYKYAKTRLTLSSPFYGALVMNADTIEVSADMAVGPTAWTDGARIYFNEDFIENISREEFTGVLLHEVLHIAFLHVARMGNYQQMKWNKATDYVINLLVKELADTVRRGGGSETIKLPEGVLFDPQWQGYSSEQVYAQLPDEDESQGGGAAGAGQAGTAAGDGDSSKGDPLGNDMKKGLTPEEMAKAKDKWQGVTAAAATGARMRGELPAGLARELDELLYPKVDWRQVVMEFVQQFPIDYDWFQRDRRTLGSQFIIPQMAGEKVQLAVAVDTSGSISQDELKAMLSETYGMMSSFGRVELTVLSCDAHVQTVGEVSSQQDLENIELKGGGGTRFEPVFEWLEENKPDTQALIYFTDGYGSYPPDQYNWKTLWVLFSDYDEHGNIPFGQVVKY